MTDPVPPHEPADRPPFFRTWGRMYAFVLGFLILLIVAFYIFGRVFS